MARKNTLTHAPYLEVLTYYDARGERLASPRSHWELLSFIPQWVTDVDWRPNEPFEAELRLRTFQRGRSSVTFEFVDEATTIRYPMFVSDVFELMKFGEVSQGLVTGEWQVVKRGTNYGLAPVVE